MTDQFQLWFDEISRQLKATNQVECLTSRFMKCRTDESRVKFVLEQKIIYDVMNIKTSFGPKSKELSVENRTKGNAFFQKKNYDVALVSYSKSVFLAPMNLDEDGGAGPSVELALALANRSAVLYHLSDTGHCLQDIQLSLKYGYPEDLRYKLFDRMGKCFSQLREAVQAKESFKRAMELLAKSKLTTEKRNVWARELFKSIKDCTDGNSGTDYSLNTKTVYERCPVIPENDKSRTFPCASTMFDIAYDPSVGRYGVANRYIKAGEVILVEQPYAEILMPQFYSTHCHNCLLRTVALLPCRQCSRVGFCSEACETEAWQNFHYVECKYLNLIHDANVGLGHLALRMVLKAGLSLLLDVKKKMNSVDQDNDPPKLGMNADEVYDSQDYWACYCLIGHSEDRSAGDLFRRTLIAVFLLKILQGSDFFICNDSEGIPINDTYYAYIGGHILKQIQMLPCNAHEVSELMVNRSTNANSELKEIGSAIYATLSLLNHSCDPSVVRHSYGSHCVLRAIKDIPKGEEIIDNYGSLYAVTPLPERQKLFKSQYYFECQCKACKENWSLYADMKDTEPIFKCENCQGAVKIVSQNDKKLSMCSCCNIEVDFSKHYMEFQNSREAFAVSMEAVIEDGVIESNIDTALDYLHLMSKWVILPWQEFNKCQELVKHCFSMMGNHYPA